jgi:hypothetical protein
VEADSIPRIHIPELIELWKLERLPFSEINQARRAALAGEAIKPLLVFHWTARRIDHRRADEKT